MKNGASRYHGFITVRPTPYLCPPGGENKTLAPPVPFSIIVGKSQQVKRLITFHKVDIIGHMSRTIMPINPKSPESAKLRKARENLEELLPEAVDAYRDIIETGKDSDRRLAAKDILEANGLVGKDIASGSTDAMASANVIKLVETIGKAFGVRPEDIRPVRDVTPEQEPRKEVESSKSESSKISDEVLEKMKKGR